MSELVKEAFSSCLVINGEIMFMKRYTPSEMLEIYKEFSADLLNKRIPHYRVFGIAFTQGAHFHRSVFRHFREFGHPLLEIADNARFIIPDKIGGNDPDKGCYFGLDENIEVTDPFRLAWGWSQQATQATRTAALLRLPEGESINGTLRENVGMLMSGNILGTGDDMIDNYETTSDNLNYFNNYMLEKPVSARTLLKGKHICYPHVPEKTDNNKSDGIHRILFLYKKGTGTMTYEQSQEWFCRGVERFMPCHVNYDLSEFFTVFYPKESDTALKLAYLSELDENVLTNILQGYGKDMV
ncbi:MAG: hypothetical protein IKL53_06640 [Lachnospiraceae bacterium]|nr:hypothetical protein [Lachnospiraceae bacterium]